MAKCKMMGVTVDLDKADALHDAVMQDATVAALWADNDAANRRWAAAQKALNSASKADFDKAADAFDAATVASSVANRAAVDATRRVAQRLVARDNLRALHARRAAV